MPLLSELMSSFAAPVRLSASAWAEANIVLPPDTNAEPGPLRLKPYQSQMIDLIDKPSTVEAILMMGAQTGKTTALDCIMLKRICTEPGPMLMLGVDEKQSTAFVRQRLDPLVASSPNLKGLFGDGRRGGSGDSTIEKKFPGGFLAIGSANKGSDLRGRSFRDVYFDEIDAYPKNVQSEGDPVELGKRRQLMFKGRRKGILASTPTYVPSPIAAQFDRGTQHRFMIPCPDPNCGNFDYVRFDMLRWTPGKPQTARLECAACGHRMTEAERLRALDLGQWQATAEPKEPGVISFHSTALISYFCDMAEVVQKYEEVQGNPHGVKTFRNLWLAEVWVPEGTELEVNALQARAEPIFEPYPAGIKDIVAGVDVQKHRLEMTYLATGMYNEQAVLDHVVIDGDPNGPQVWDDLDRALDRVFTLEGGRKLGVLRVGIDSGYNPDPVYAFCLEHRRKRVCQPVKGAHGFDKPAAFYSGIRVPGRPNILHIGVDSIKEQIYKRSVQTPSGPNGLHFPNSLDVGYFEQIAAERLVVEERKSGPKMKWQKVKTNSRNEALDCLCYAIAIRTRIKDDEAGSNVVNLSDRVADLHRISNQ
ncbi:MAG: terminase gpA endonuclease subunit [Janthinobacterium lividum]